MPSQRTDTIRIRGLRQNNLKNISFDLPKHKLIVFTGVSGSGKSSIVFDTIAAEATRQMNETYPPYLRSRLPKYPKPDCDTIENLSPAVVIDQTPLGSTARSTVGTASEIYAGLRLLFSRIGEPYVGSASCFSFNDPAGMCPTCFGLGVIFDVAADRLIDTTKSLNEGALTDSMVKPGSWYWKQFIKSGLFDPDKPLCSYSDTEMNLLLYGKGDLQGLIPLYRKRYLTRDASKIAQEKAPLFLTEKPCPSCQGKRLNRIALSCWINGFSIDEFSTMDLTALRRELQKIADSRVQELISRLVSSLSRMIEIGLGYLSLSRATETLSGGEAQRVKLVRYLGFGLSDMLYIFDEPSAGMHPRDVYRLNRLLRELCDKGNTVLVVEHDKDVICAADLIVDIGPGAGCKGGEVVFCGTYQALLASGTRTGEAMKACVPVPEKFVTPSSYLKVTNATLHNLKNCSVDVPLGCLCVVTGVAGSGKSSLMEVFCRKYASEVIYLDQKPITATNRSTPASYLGFMNEIRREFARANNTPEGLFSFNSIGACPHCKGKGVIVTELAFMDPVVTVCEVCGGARFNSEALSCRFEGKTILEVLRLTVAEAYGFFTNRKILRWLHAMSEAGLSYLTLGQPLSTLSGGERQRLKLAKCIEKVGRIYVLDEPTTGLHPSDIDGLIRVFRGIVDKGGSVIIIEHNVDVMKAADYIIDVGPDGGNAGGEVVFCGTPREMLSADTITAAFLRGNGFSEMRCESEKIYESEDGDVDGMTGLRIVPIGRVEVDDGRYRVVLKSSLRAALEGLEGFSHVQVLWWFDGCDTERDRGTLVQYKPYTKGPECVGTFATRSPQRPNPIAVSVAEVLSVDKESGVITLCYIDARSGSPVLDIKPYTPSADRVECAVVPAWCSHWPMSYEGSGEFDWESEFNFTE